MIRVASYNIHKGVGTDRQRRPDRILAVLNEIDADVVALQEADRRFGERVAVLTPHLLAEHGWRAVPLGMRAQSSGWHGNSLLVRRDARLLCHGEIHLPALEPRGAVSADLELSGRQLRIVGMHLDLSGLWRRKQARAIIAHLAALPPLPTVVMGDTNEWSRGGCLRDFGGAFAFAETGPSYHARAPVGRLDRIMVSPGLHVAQGGVHASATARHASDHLPVWAELDG
jgi:endonuclease/exonuclease/phosphatase family metal-dependent hydrolase